MFLHFGAVRALFVFVELVFVKKSSKRRDFFWPWHGPCQKKGKNTIIGSFKTEEKMEKVTLIETLAGLALMATVFTIGMVRARMVQKK